MSINTSLKIMTCLASFIFLLQYTVRAQTLKPCGTVELQRRMFANDPAAKRNFDSIQQFIRQKSQEVTANRLLFPGAPYRIQTVVHVLGTDANTNPTDAQIRTMIDNINTNLRGADPDLVNLPPAFANEQAGNTSIQLCLTDISLAGLPTNGIVRHVTATNNYFIAYGPANQFAMSATDPAMGGIAIWDRNRYLNILITPTNFDTDDAGSGQRVGVSSFPGFPANLDCFIVRRGDMLEDAAHTHELGHWLNLIHIWGDEVNCDGSDQVDDTPNQGDNSQATTSTCSFPKISCNNGPDGDMYMNYMDYSNCYSMFTNGQETRMINALNFNRSGIFSTNCAPDVTLSGNLIGMYRAGNAINSVIGPATVPNGNTVYLQAGSRITLRPGFRANNGSAARIYIKPCCINQ
jgi:hypothetical protein